jgi:hypothetical protein
MITEGNVHAGQSAQRRMKISSMVACVVGAGVRKEIRTYTSMTNDLLRLKGWLSLPPLIFGHQSGPTKLKKARSVDEKAPQRLAATLAFFSLFHY